MGIKIEIQRVMDEAVKNKEVAGCNALIIQNGRELAYAESGCKDIDGKVPFSRDTIMRLYSMSKPITSAAVMILMDRGLIDLQDSVGKYIDTYNDMWVSGPNGRERVNKPITLQNLMNMTAGTCYPGDDCEASRQAAKLFDEAIGRLDGPNEMTTMELVRRIGTLDLAFQPGQTFRYSTCADILGGVVEAVTGMLFGDFLKKEIFEPLGMDDTDFYVPAEKKNRLAQVYKVSNGNIEEDKTTNLDISYTLEHRPAFESGGAGLCSTLDDYAKFARMLLNGGSYEGKRILSKKAVEFMTSGKLQSWQQSGFDPWQGLQGYSYGNLMRVLYEPGRGVGYGEAGEYGWDGWLGAYFSNDPKNDLTILMGMQKIDAGTWALQRKVRNMVYKELK